MERYKQTLYTLLAGACLGVVIVLAVLVLSDNVPWLKAAGVGTGAPDVNARYLDGFSTQQGGTAAANKIYVSDTSGYLPDNSVDTGAIVDGTVSSADIADGTITSADIATDTIAAGDIAAGAVGTSEITDGSVSISADLNLATDGSGSGLDADLVDGFNSTSFAGNNCLWFNNNSTTARGNAICKCGTGYLLRLGGCIPGYTYPIVRCSPTNDKAYMCIDQSTTKTLNAVCYCCKY